MAEKVQIDQDECIGCETCVELCKSVFAFNEDDGKAYVIDEDTVDKNCVKEAIGSCPAECISCE